MNGFGEEAAAMRADAQRRAMRIRVGIVIGFGTSILCSVVAVVFGTLTAAALGLEHSAWIPAPVLVVVWVFLVPAWIKPLRFALTGSAERKDR